MLSKQIAATTLACLSPQFIFAHGNPEDHAPEDLGITTAVGRRADQVVDTTTSKLHILRPEKLRNIGVYDVSSALDRLPGVVINRSSQAGTTQGIWLRGLRTTDTQLRVDGVRLTSAYSGVGSFFSQISGGSLSRIEVLKGSQASLYGSSANGGVVNLRTKLGADSIQNRFTVEAGSFNSFSAESDYGGTVGKLSYYWGSVSSTTDNDTYKGNSESAFDNDYISYQNALRIGYNVNDDLHIGLTIRSIQSIVETPQFGGSRTKDNFYLGTMYGDYQVNDIWKTKLTVSGLIQNTYFGSSFGVSKVDYNQVGASWENAVHYSGAGSINFGLEYEHQDYTGFKAPNGRRDHYTAAYLNHAYDFNNLTLESGIRYEDYRSFGNHTSWRTGARYVVDHTGTVIKGNIGTGFNSPDFLQLFSPFSPFSGVAGNPNLSPETSLGWDITVEQQIGKHHKVRASFFETDIKNAILADAGTALFQNTAGKTSASGIEFGIEGELRDRVHYNANYTWLDRSFNGQPSQSANASIVFSPNKKLKLGLGAQYLDQRSYGGTAQLKDALIVRAFGSYQVHENVRFHARLENLTDTEYNHISFGATSYPARRLSAHAGVTLEW